MVEKKNPSTDKVDKTDKVDTKNWKPETFDEMIKKVKDASRGALKSLSEAQGLLEDSLKTTARHYEQDDSCTGESLREIRFAVDKLNDVQCQLTHAISGGDQSNETRKSAGCVSKMLRKLREKYYQCCRRQVCCPENPLEGCVPEKKDRFRRTFGTCIEMSDELQKDLYSTVQAMERLRCRLEIAACKIAKCHLDHEEDKEIVALRDARREMKEAFDHLASLENSIFQAIDRLE